MDTPPIEISQFQLKLISEIDQFKGKWKELTSLAPAQLAALRKVATIASTGSSTRIEGAKLTDGEVEKLLTGLQRESFRSRDEEEVAGYAESVDLVSKSYTDIPIDENHIKQLHKNLLNYTAKDIRHRGEYKKVPNHVEAYDQNGKSLGIVFETAKPFDTPLMMKELVDWFNATYPKRVIHPLLSIAIFVVHFLAIHPFQDGNGRLSRILTTLLLLKNGYLYVPYLSLEHIIEENKDQYYFALRRSQKTIYTDNSTLDVWITFFLRTTQKQVAALEMKIRNEAHLARIPPLSEKILRYTRERGRLTIKDAVLLTQKNRNTVKAHIRKLVQRGLLNQMGTGKGTWYRSA